MFVRWRQRDAPFGYDLATPMSAPADEVLVVDVDVSASYRTVDPMDPVELIQRLQLRAVPLPLGGIAADPELCGLKELALALVAPGLAARTLAYLWRLEVPMAGYYVELDGDHRPSLLLRLRHPRGRALDVLAGTPGVELLAPVSARAAVEIGYKHPIQLASASACFPGEEMFLFRGRVRRVERLDAAPRFIDGRHLVQNVGASRLREVAQLREAELDPLRVELKLRPSTHPREPRGTLIGWDQVDLLRHLVYLIPPSALAASRLVPLEEGVVVLTGSSVGARSAAAAAGLGGGCDRAAGAPAVCRRTGRARGGRLRAVAPGSPRVDATAPRAVHRRPRAVPRAGIRSDPRATGAAPAAGRRAHRPHGAGRGHGARTRRACAAAGRDRKPQARPVRAVGVRRVVGAVRRIPGRQRPGAHRRLRRRSGAGTGSIGRGA